MLIDITSHEANEAILELLEYAAYDDDRELEEVLEQYRIQEDLRLYAYRIEDRWIGIIGGQLVDDKLILKHLAVHPEERGLGYGRGMILEILVACHPSEIVAETDEVGADFFRNVGFQVHGFTKYVGGPEYFRCVYDARPQAE